MVDVGRAARRIWRAVVLRRGTRAAKVVGRLTARPAMSREAIDDAAEYLRECGIQVPAFKRRVYRRAAGSYVTGSPTTLVMHLGSYPTRRLADWFAMHELVHVLWARNRPTRDPTFREWFGTRRPRNYDDIPWTVRATTSLRRPSGFPSRYAEMAGGEEHFAELVAFMYTRPNGFASKPPADLAASWNVAWKRGITLMR